MNDEIDEVTHLVKCDICGLDQGDVIDGECAMCRLIDPMSTDE